MGQLLTDWSKCSGLVKDTNPFNLYLPFHAIRHKNGNCVCPAGFIMFRFIAATPS
jgi:hypothetical protein